MGRFMSTETGHVGERTTNVCELGARECERLGHTVQMKL